MIFNRSTAACLLIALALLTACKKDPDAGQALPPSLTIADISDAEGNVTGTISFNVYLSEGAKDQVRVRYTTLDGTAKAGSDYTGKTNGELIFAPGETAKVIDLPLLGDTVNESDETFKVQLSNPIGATLTRALATATIRNDDAYAPITVPMTGYSTPETYPGKFLVWRDEFESTNLNPASWSFETGAGGWGNNELQYYRSENTRFAEGNLVIEARKEDFSGAPYTSSRLVTKDKREFKFGRIDIRAALPEGQGIWPALWMLGSNLSSVSWPACGEIDIMELIGNEPNRVHGTAHFGANFSQYQYKGNSKTLPGAAKFSDEFHVFSIIWEQDRIRWLLDDVQFHELTAATVSPAPYPFNQPFFFIFNVAVGGNWPGSPNGTTTFPQHLIVDYVRVFQD